MIIKIKTENALLASLILKNPSTNEGLDLYKSKNGVFVGNFISNKEYHVVFQDTKYSYSFESNMLDIESFCNPRVILDIFNNFFRHILKSDFKDQKPQWLNTSLGEIDIENNISIEFYVNINSNWANKKNEFVISKHFNEVKIEHQIGTIYKLTISGNLTLFKAMNLTSLVCLFLSVTNKQYFETPIDLINRYIQIMENIGQIPYFIVYLFKVRLLQDRDVFERFKTRLETIGGITSLTYGNTQDVRKETVKSILYDDSTSIVDIGCGELEYAKMFMRDKPKTYIYYAIDKEESLEKVAVAINKRYDAQLKFYTKIEDCKPKEKANILLSEVIEHNTQEDAEKLLQYVVDNFDINKIVITTVNKDFNKHYSSNEEFTRRDDHVFEMTDLEFKDFIYNFANKNNLSSFFFKIGDIVDGHSPTSGVQLCKK